MKQNKKNTIPIQKKQVVLELQNISKTYVTHHQKPTLSEKLLLKSTQNKFLAVDNVSFKLFKGERIGITGPNGSGKTTLLKIIAGITTPDSGIIYSNGKIVSLIDLDAGFHPDLTGKENINLNGLLLGMSKKQIETQYRNIVNFAEIGDFLDSPMFTYSAGMRLRLSFAIAIHSEPKILLADEFILVGDESFRKKIMHKLNVELKNKISAVFVSHSEEFLKKNCDRIFDIRNLQSTQKK